MMRTLFLQGPSHDGFDGGAGARYQARREIRSFWYPTWLAQPAAMVEGSKLIDAPPHRLKLADILPEVSHRELVVMHTSVPSFSADVKTAAALKAANPALKIGMIGSKVAVEPEKSLKASDAIDFVARNEFDYTIKEVAEGRELGSIAGLSWRNNEGAIVHNEDRAVLEDMDALPFVSPVYKRDLVIENYYNGYLKHPYLSFYTGRGCKSRCTFCLWPQTIGGHKYRTRSVGHVMEEVLWAQKAFPQVKELFFDDDTLTDDLPRVEALAREMGKLGIEWCCIGFAAEMNPHTIQVSLAAPYPGTFLYKQAVENDWFAFDETALLSDCGTQMAPLRYPHLSHTEINRSVDEFYRRFYFRAGKIAAIMGEMMRSPDAMRRRLREGVEFFQYLRQRRAAAL
jgi:hypothetical protein